MKPKVLTKDPQKRLFEIELARIVDENHELIHLSKAIDWPRFEAQFGQNYSDHGAPAIRTRLVESYVHGPRVDETLRYRRYQYHNGNLVSTGSYYLQENALGSTIRILDAQTGNGMLRFRYDVFGKAYIAHEGTPNNYTYYNSVMLRFLYTGREYFQGVNLYDYRNRVYSPSLGRFLQTDPIRFDAGDVNWYRYVFNNPINWTDSEGLACGSSGPWWEPGADWMIPDRWGGGIDFSGPCAAHDACYGTPCFDKKMCDDKFLQDMRRVCHSAGMRNPGIIPVCLLLADIYYRAVRVGGCGAYKKAQKAAGNQNPECT